MSNQTKETLELLIKAHLALTESGLTPKAFLFLGAIIDTPYLTAKAYHEKYGFLFSRNSYTRMGMELEGLGLIATGVRPETGRGTVYYPTPEGAYRYALLTKCFSEKNPSGLIYTGSAQVPPTGGGPEAENEA